MTAREDGGALTPDIPVKSISETFREIADAYATEMINAGADPHVAGSVVANLMMREAWAIAGSGKIMAGKGAPNIEVFLDAAREMAGMVTFLDPAARAALSQPDNGEGVA